MLGVRVGLGSKTGDSLYGCSESPNFWGEEVKRSAAGGISVAGGVEGYVSLAAQAVQFPVPSTR